MLKCLQLIIPIKLITEIFEYALKNTDREANRSISYQPRKSEILLHGNIKMIYQNSKYYFLIAICQNPDGVLKCLQLIIPIKLITENFEYALKNTDREANRSISYQPRQSEILLHDKFPLGLIWFTSRDICQVEK